MYPVLSDWVNPKYLSQDGIFDIRESIKAKPDIKYCILDDFFLPHKIEELIKHHATLTFSEAADRTNGVEVLPYDGAVKWADQTDVGHQFYFAEETQAYFCHLLNKFRPQNTSVELKLRWHKPQANGFWIHSDSVWRSVVAIVYFNKGWSVSNGGLLQLWRPDESASSLAVEINSVKPEQRLDCLVGTKRVKTDTPGGGWPKDWTLQSRDMILVDQIVPAYNRLFLCDLDANPTFHSVTPSVGRERTGFVYWLNNKSHPSLKDRK